MRAIYLHGFASSARSSKAAFLRERFAERGITLECPDFNEPDFASLTISRMIAQVGEAVGEADGSPAALIGSSLGAFVALQAACRWAERIDRLVLLAPAVDLRPQRLGELGDRTLAEWKASGTLNVFHYGFGRPEPLGYGLYEDACSYDAITLSVPHPIQVFQGRRDTAVNPAFVQEWSRARPNVELHMLDDDHQLHASLGYIWREIRRFLNLT